MPSIVMNYRISLIGILCVAQWITAEAQDVNVRHLTVDHLEHTEWQVSGGYLVAGHGVGQQALVASRRPVLGWILSSDRNGARQSAYRIIVSRHADSVRQGIGTVWDSGKVSSQRSTNVPYNGPALLPNQAYYWRVMIWDDRDGPSAWSPVRSFRTADTLEDYRTAHYALLKTDERPERLVWSEGVFFADFGRAAFAQLRLTVIAKRENDTLTVRLGETLDRDGRINRNPGGTIRYAAYRLPLRIGRHTYQLQFRPDGRNTGPQAIKMPEDIGEVLPFRYVELEGDIDVTPADLVRSSVHYPFDDQASYFESSDSILNAVWTLCKYTIKATSFAGIYVDGDRERIPYEADAYINQLCHYSVDREYTMARRTHEYLLHRATWPTEWILQSVLMAYNDFLYTGDIRSVQSHYDDLKAKLLLPLRSSNGLVSTRTGKQTPQLMASIYFQGDSLRDIVDWPHPGAFGMSGNGETDGFVFTEYNAVVNAFHYRALRCMAELAIQLDRTDDAELFTAKADETYEAFQHLLWDNRRQVYRDGPDTEHASLHTNMLSLAFGLVPRERQQDVMAFIRSRGMACSVYGSQFLLDAIYEAGDANYGLALLTATDSRSWYNMIRAGSTMTMEAWDNRYKPNQDWNHAWGAVPANIIPRRLMGVEPLVPGWELFRVRPQLGQLAHARVQVPTIKGPVVLACHQREGSYTMELSVPFNTEARVEIPLSGWLPDQVTVNGEVVATEQQDGVVSLPSLAGGTYRIVLASGLR